jgi:hypothetical protein
MHLDLNRTATRLIYIDSEWEVPQCVCLCCIISFKNPYEDLPVTRVHEFIAYIPASVRPCSHILVADLVNCRRYGRSTDGPLRQRKLRAASVDHSSEHRREKLSGYPNAGRLVFAMNRFGGVSKYNQPVQQRPFT